MESEVQNLSRYSWRYTASNENLRSITTFFNRLDPSPWITAIGTLTRGLTAHNTKEGADLPHPHELAASCAKAQGLVKGGGCDERPVVPESDGVGYRWVPLGEEILKLVGLEVVRYGLIATVFGPTFAFPTLAAYRLPLHLLLLWRVRQIPFDNTHHCNYHHNRQTPPFDFHFACKNTHKWIGVINELNEPSSYLSKLYRKTSFKTCSNLVCLRDKPISNKL